MIYRLFVVIVLLVSPSLLYSRGFTTIRGNIGNANGYQIRLHTWGDQVSFIEKRLAAATIDSQGNFNLITELDGITHAFFYIGNIRSDIILEPGKAYEIRFDDYPPLSFLETRNLLLQRETIRYVFLNQPEDDINLLAAEASAMYNRFLANHYMDLYYKNYDVIDAFIDTFFLRFGTYTHPWIRQMVDFRIAGLKLAGYKITMEQAHALWLRGVDFDYHHPDFMEFFNQLFSNYLTTRLRHYTYSELVSVINDRGSFSALSELVGRDTVLRNELLREMVIIKGLGEIVNHRDFQNGQVMRILQHIASTSKFPEHRTIAANLVHLHRRFNKGIMAPDFSLPDRSGTLHSLSQYRGKYLYLVFFTANCVPCLSELRLLASAYTSMKEDMEVLAVGLDPDSTKLWRVAEQQGYPWPVVHFNHNFDLTDRFNIRNYPFFILIAPDGTFEQYGARLPSERFRLWFEEVVLNRR